MDTVGSQDLEKACMREGSSCKTRECVETLEDRVSSVGLEGDYVRLGTQLFRRQDLRAALGPCRAPLADPVPLGLSSFSFSCMILGLYNAEVLGVTNHQLLVGVAFFLGGLAQMLAGLLSFGVGNTFGLTVFSIFGSFWFCHGAIITNSFGVLETFAEDPEMLRNAMGLFQLCWVVFTLIMLLCSLKSSWSLFALLVTLDLTFLLLAIGNFADIPALGRAAGWTGFVSSICGWYTLYAEMANLGNTYLAIPKLHMPHSMVA
ncbi:AaceriAFR144Wp [[Ashbya] aceris (nom. inval.)]|nr:AaceriAFR144Wp [[Ashbya] aceris (nom. inval.)]